MNGTTETFDYVIAGGGSAGCLLAWRLSENPRNRVCLIEAGPEDGSPMIRVPLGFTVMLARGMFNWMYLSAPSEHLGGRRIFAPRGKVLGGTSAINGMVYMRGDPRDYDEWARDCPGWSFREVMPHFLRLENNADFRSSPYHGTDGPVHVMFPTRPSRITRLFLEGAAGLGFKTGTDYNGADQEGFELRQVTQTRGLRDTAATTFLRPARKRPNLRVRTGLTVDRVLLEGKRATGVVCRDAAGAEVTIRAGREVVLCGGAFGSPAMLERSGIGQAGLLTSLGIDVAHELPGVGANLHDHPTVGVQLHSPSAPTYGVSVRGVLAGAAALGEYALLRRGMFASNIVESGGFIRSTPDQPRCDLQVTLMPARRGSSGYFGIGHGYSLSAILMRPKSRGSVHVASRAPQADPLIDFNLLADTADFELMLEGLRLSRKLLNTPPLRRYGSTEDWPGAGVKTDEQMRDYIRRSVATAFHPVGSCRMGADPMAVVDAELKVHGIEGLRVADASIMPSIIGGNTNIPTYAIADKAADMMLGLAPPAPWTHPDPRAADVTA